MVNGEVDIGGAGSWPDLLRRVERMVPTVLDLVAVGQVLGRTF